MAKIEIRLPEMGESVAEATITSWTKSIGDRVEEDEVIVEVATDKVDSEIISEYTGILIEQRFAIDEVAEVGSVIAVIETEGGIDDFASAPSSMPIETSNEPEEVVEPMETVEEEPTPEIIEEIESSVSQQLSKSNSLASGLLSPLVRNMAKEEGISDEELSRIQGTGLDGRVTKYDMIAYLETRNGSISAVPNDTFKKPASTTVPSPATGDEIIELNRMAKLTADHMIGSLQTSAHVQSFIEVDMTRVVDWRSGIKDEFERTHGGRDLCPPRPPSRCRPGRHEGDGLAPVCRRRLRQPGHHRSGPRRH
jgi:2-oxoglutarate dehydrogenase E2 component (dihydrolipoamide succinyltransferase)